MSNANPNSRLNKAQLMLLNVFSIGLSENDLRRLHDVLLDFYEEIVQREILVLQETKGLNQEKLDALQNSHPVRRPYPSPVLA